MQLNPEGQARFRNHLQNVIRKPRAVCGEGNWNFDDTVFEMRQFAGGPLPAQGAIKPVVTLTCQSCGNIVFLNALTTGIVRVEQGDQSTNGAQAAVPADMPTAEIAEEDSAA
jgi:hypothetical protein